MQNKQFSVLILIFCLGSFLRFFQLGTVPTGFHRDEAFLGYNAYSLLKTGNDMSGNRLPLHFASFIYSPGGYSYFAIPAIGVFGLNEFSVRFPSAFFGSLTIIMVFFLVKKLFPNISINVPLASAFFLAITPWHINLSRTSTESILVVFFISLGMYLFFHWNQTKKNHFLFLSFLSFALTLALYQAPRAFLPLLLPLMIVTTVRLKYKNVGIAFSCYFLLIIIPIILILTSPTLATRMRTVGIWSTEETKLVIEEQIREDGVRNVPPLLSRVVHNKLIGYSEVFLKNYFQHLTYDFLFTDSGYPDRYRVPNAGLLYFSMLPFIVAGFIFLFKRYLTQGILLTGWILLSIVGSALTFDDIPNLQRTVFVFPALAIIMGFGFASFASFKSLYKVFILGILCICITFEWYRYMHHYYIQQVVHRPWYRHEGYKQLVTEVEKRKAGYKNIVVTNKESAPTIFFLFYSQYDPASFQEETRNSIFRDFDRIPFSNYLFSLEECPLLETKRITNQPQDNIIDCVAEPNTLYVNSGICELPKICGNIFSVIKRKDQTSVFTVLESSNYVTESQTQ